MSDTTSQLGDLVEKMDPEEAVRIIRETRPNDMAAITHATVAMERYRRRLEEQQQAQERGEADLLAFGEREGEYLRQYYPGAYRHVQGLKQRKAEEKTATTRSQHVQGLAAQIGQGIQAIPEWQEVAPEDKARLERALVGKSDAEVLDVFTKAATDLLPEKKAAKMQAQELAKARQVKPKKPPVDIKGMSDQEFRDYAWKKWGLKTW